MAIKNEKANWSANQSAKKMKYLFTVIISQRCRF